MLRQQRDDCCVREEHVRYILYLSVTQADGDGRDVYESSRTAEDERGAPCGHGPPPVV